MKEDPVECVSAYSDHEAFICSELSLMTSNFGFGFGIKGTVSVPLPGADPDDLFSDCFLAGLRPVS